MMSRAQELLSAPLGLELLHLISRRGAAGLTDDDLDGLLIELNFRYRGDYEEYVAFLKSNAGALRSLGEWLTERMARWWDDVDRSQQVWVGPSTAPPDEGNLVVDVAPSHPEAPKPKRAFWTSTRTTAVSPWLDYPENFNSGWKTTWLLVVRQDARVVEIHSPAAWSELARAYPLDEAGYTFTGMKHPPDSSRRLDPDWSKVSLDFDGVHLSVGGWLTAEDLPVESGGATTELRGWNMESTVWLRWAFSSVELLPPAA
jgi:hypothetical protein